MKKVSRRDFIKGAVASGALVAAGGVLAACSNENNSTANQGNTPSVQWDMETDVLILGAGGAGMCAGYEATQAGAKAMILEKTNNWGGTSVRSGGIIQASGTAVQKELTEYQDDNGDKHADYYLQEGEGMLHEDLVRDMTNNSASHIEWLESLGLKFTNVTGSAHVPMADESLYADRIHGTDVGAAGVFGAVHDVAEQSGVEFVYETEATKLITENGKVVGVVAKQGDKEINVKANKGVIIATSSIDHNQEMCRALSPNQYYDNEHAVCVAAPSNTGDGIRMAAEVGAQLSHFGGVIDLTGKTSAGINRQTPLMPCFFVDQATLDGMVEAGTAFKGATMAELAAQIDVDADNLQMTLDQWNRDITESGKDKQFDRATGLNPIEGPFYAFEEGFMNLGSIGGVLIDLDCEVLNGKGEAIEGLYAAGMASAGWLGSFYPGSGTALLGAIHWGRKAGKVVAAK